MKDEKIYEAYEIIKTKDEQIEKKDEQLKSKDKDMKDLLRTKDVEMRKTTDLNC